MFREKFNTGSGLDKIEGVVTLELRNAKTGKLEDRVESHNFIAPPALERHQWAQRNYFKSGIYSLQNNRDSDYQPVSPFNTFYLSTSTKDTNSPEEEFMVPGEILGHAVKETYSGPSIYRGSPEGNGSEATTTYTKWVFTWPDIAANGTIGSVGWMGSVRHDLNLSLSAANGATTFVSSNTTTARWGYFARASDTQSFAIENVFMDNADTATTVSVLNSQYQPSSTFNTNGQFTHTRGVAWDGGNSRLWIIGRNNTNYYIAAYNASGANTVSPIAITGRDYRTLTFDGTNLWTAVQNGTTVTVYSINPSDGSDVGNFTYSIPSPSGYAESHAGLAWDATRQFLWVKIHTRYDTGNSSNWSFRETRIIPFDTSGVIMGGAISSMEPWVKAYTGSTINIHTMSHYLADFDMADANTFLVPGYSSSLGNFIVSTIKGTCLGSRALLPSTVTKLNTQTLTVTYQMNYPYPGAY